jgi:D-alanine-D-alanine ligase
LPVAKSFVVDRKAAAAKHLMEPPYVVKPVNEGSSAGIFIVRQGANRPPAALAAKDWKLSSRMMVEEFVPGRELTVSVMGANSAGEARALGVTEIVTDLEFYDYEAKYAPGGSRHVIPAAVPANITRDCMEMAVLAHNALGCRGVSRTDFRYDDSGGRLILLETNTQPGMTPTSLVPEQAAHAGMSYGRLCRWMVEDASCDR